MTKELAIYQTICQLEMKRFRKGISQLETVLNIAIDVWDTNCNLSKDIYPMAAKTHKCSSCSIERNIRKLLGDISVSRLSKITGRNLQDPITVKYFVEILVKHIQNTYTLTN